MSIEQKIKFPNTVIPQKEGENKKNRIHMRTRFQWGWGRVQMKIFLAPSYSVYENFIDLSSKSHGNEMKILNLTIDFLSLTSS